MARDDSTADDAAAAPDSTPGSDATATAHPAMGADGATAADPLAETAGKASTAGVSVPEYGVNPFLREEESPFGWKRLRAEYGWIRGYFKSRPQRFRELQRSLNQAQMGLTYDQYLMRATRLGVLAGFGGLFVGVFLTYALIATGYIGQLRSPVLFYGLLGDLVVANKTLLTGVVVSILTAAVLSTITFGVLYYYPKTVADRRRRNMDILLPHAIVFMYALSYGGMSLVEIIRRLADAEDAYGEIANEFEMVERDVDLFGNDVSTALQNARNLTPSDSVEQFFDDMLSVLDSGGDLSLFFETQSEAYLEDAKEEQEAFLETLSILSEFFIALFVAAPLFFIVTLMVMSLVGGNTLDVLAILVYAILPLGMAGFLVLIDLLSQPYVQPRTQRQRLTDTEQTDRASELGDDRRFERYRRRKRRTRIREFLTDPLRGVRVQPLLSLVVTVPAAIGLLVAMVATGDVSLSLADIVATPIRSTTRLVVLPLLVVAAPLSWFHERRRGREKVLMERVPDALNILSSANKMGIRFTEPLGLVARWSTSAVVGRELRIVRNDIVWNFDTHQALSSFADRLSVPQLSRTIKLLAEGTRSSSDLSTVLSIAAEDARERAKVERARRRELSTYVGIVVIGFLVYLLVVVLLDIGYLQPITEAARTQDDVPENFPIGLSGVPVDTYRTMFFHSALVQGFGSGLLAGKLADNEVLSGLKYGILLVVISLLVFAFV